MVKNIWRNLRSFLQLACWVFISVEIMRAAEHFGASQVEAGCATIAAVIVYLWSLGVSGLEEIAPNIDEVIRNSRLGSGE